MIVDLSAGAPITMFLSGVCMATFVASGLIFFKFWRSTREVFFGFFGSACWLIAIERLVLVRTVVIHEVNSSVYFLRLLAFALIMIAVWRTNRTKAN